MHLEAILDLPIFQLPVKNNTADPFVVFAELTISNYIAYVTTSRDLFDSSHPKFVDYKEYCDIVTEFGSGLIEVLRKSKQDGVVKAYQYFCEVMRKSATFMLAHQHASYYAERNSVFYRCKDADLVQPQDRFFHTPFDIDYLVSPTRFSLNGAPSLYLTNCLIVGFLEVRATDYKNLQAVKYQPQIPLKFLNIEPSNPHPYLKIEDRILYDELLQIKGMLFPLLFLCLCEKNDERNVVAPQEYIIPQFLAQWVKDYKRFVGIKYPSTKIKGDGYQKSFFNLFIPPVQIADKGHCNKLKTFFKISDVCFAARDEDEILDFFQNEFVKVGSINPDVNYIEWDADVKEYHKTEIGRMEFFLKHKLVSDIIKF